MSLHIFNVSWSRYNKTLYSINCCNDKVLLFKPVLHSSAVSVGNDKSSSILFQMFLVNQSASKSPRKSNKASNSLKYMYSVLSCAQILEPSRMTEILPLARLDSITWLLITISSHRQVSALFSLQNPTTIGWLLLIQHCHPQKVQNHFLKTGFSFSFQTDNETIYWAVLTPTQTYGTVGEKHYQKRLSGKSWCFGFIYIQLKMKSVSSHRGSSTFCIAATKEFF